MICYFCCKDNETEEDRNPFIAHKGIAICLDCLIQSVDRIYEYMAGELEYSSWRRNDRHQA